MTDADLEKAPWGADFTRGEVVDGVATVEFTLSMEYDDSCYGTQFRETISVLGGDPDSMETSGSTYGCDTCGHGSTITITFNVAP